MNFSMIEPSNQTICYLYRKIWYVPFPFLIWCLSPSESNVVDRLSVFYFRIFAAGKTLNIAFIDWLIDTNWLIDTSWLNVPWFYLQLVRYRLHLLSSHSTTFKCSLFTFFLNATSCSIRLQLLDILQRVCFFFSKSFSFVDKQYWILCW